MPVRPINTSHAVIHTVSVDIKIMRIDKKQVTLSVFRQLPEENIFIFSDEYSAEDVGEFGWDYSTDDDGNEVGSIPPNSAAVVHCGIPWGIVKYTWKDSPDWCTQYLVWVRRNRIFRMPFPDIGDLTELSSDEPIRELFTRLVPRSWRVNRRVPSGIIVPYEIHDDLINNLRECLSLVVGRGLDQLFIAI